MRVLIVSEPGIDGVFRHVEGLTRYLIRQGIEVALAYSSLRSGEQLKTLVAEIKDRGMPVLDLQVGNAPCPADVGAFIKLIRLAQNFQPDVVHGHSSKGGVLARALKIFRRKGRYFYSAHAYYGMNGKSGLRTTIYNKIEQLFGGLGYTINMSKSEAVFAIETVRIDPARQYFIWNGVDTERFSPVSDATKSQLRSQLGLPPDACIFGTVGRTSAQKNPLTIYQALVEALKQRPNLYFAHLGRGEMDEEINQFIAANGLSDRVRRIPFMSDPAPFYQALDCFILTSIYEGMSYAVLETLSVNLPLALSSSPGNIDFGDFGLSHIYWNEPRDASKLAENLVRCLDEMPTIRKTINHRAIAIDCFSEAACYGKTIAAYEGKLPAGAKA